MGLYRWFDILNSPNYRQKWVLSFATVLRKRQTRLWPWSHLCSSGLRGRPSRGDCYPRHHLSVLSCPQPHLHRLIIRHPPPSSRTVSSDRIASLIRTILESTAASLTLAQILESATWKGGREIAKLKRPETDGPPIEIESDRTVFWELYSVRLGCVRNKKSFCRFANL